MRRRSQGQRMRQAGLRTRQSCSTPSCCCPFGGRGGTVDLLDMRAITPGQRGPTIELPLFHVDRIGRSAVDQAVDQGSASYSLPGSGEVIRFRRIGSDIEAVSPFTGESSSAPQTEFDKAFSSFHISIVKLVQREIPHLAEHPWLREPEPWSA